MLNSCLEVTTRLAAFTPAAHPPDWRQHNYHTILKLISDRLLYSLAKPNQQLHYWYCIPRSYPPLWRLQIKLKGLHFRFGVCGQQMREMKDGTQKHQMDSLLSLLQHLSLSKRTCLIGGNTGRSMPAYARSIFSQQQRRVGQKLNCCCHPTCTQLFLPAGVYTTGEGGGGGAFYPHPCFCSQASHRECQERASMLKDRHKWQQSNLFGSLVNCLI